jgi:hypothetical protein
LPSRRDFALAAQVRITVGGDATINGGSSMYAVVSRVSIAESEGASEKVLREEIVPRVKQAPGFVAGYWMWKGDSGLSAIIRESEETANNLSEQVRSALPEDVTLEEIEVREVVAHA